MKEKFILLRNFKKNENVSSFSNANNNIELDIDIIDFEKKNVATLLKDTSVIDFAPSIPMNLIDPVKFDTNGQTLSDKITWGIKAVKADSSPFTGKGITVAVLDTGIDPTHPAFKDIKKIIQKNFTDDTEEDDENGHGTHCAGTIFGKETDGIRIGVAPGVENALIGKVLDYNGSGASEQIINGIKWAADNKADIISMSLGFDFPGYVNSLINSNYPPDLATSKALMGYSANVRLFENLVSFLQSSENSVPIIIAAAGNESKRDINPEYEIIVSPPAASKGIISVAALGKTDDKLNVASFSNIGATISGPGVDILSAKATKARGEGNLISFNGTSMATPHIAGLAALWAEKLIRESSRLNILELTSVLISSGKKNDIISGTDYFDFGSGLATAPQD